MGFKSQEWVCDVLDKTFQSPQGDGRECLHDEDHFTLGFALAPRRLSARQPRLLLKGFLSSPLDELICLGSFSLCIF